MSPIWFNTQRFLKHLRCFEGNQYRERCFCTFWSQGSSRILKLFAMVSGNFINCHVAWIFEYLSIHKKVRNKTCCEFLTEKKGSTSDTFCRSRTAYESASSVMTITLSARITVFMAIITDNIVKILKQKTRMHKIFLCLLWYI